MRCRSAFLALAVVALPGVARADWPADGVLLSSFGNRNNDAVQMFRDSSSDVLIEWRRNANAKSECVQRVTADGALSPGWPADAVRLNYDWLQHVCALDDSGGLYEVFQGPGAGDSLERTRGDAVQLPASDPYSWPLGITTDLKNSPTIVGDGMGGSYVGWGGEFLTSATFYCGLSRQQIDGVIDPGWPDSAIIVASSGMTSPPSPGLLRDPMGGVYFAWIGTGARLKRYNEDGTLGAGWSVQGRVVSSTIPDATKPIALATSGSDHAIAMWYEKPTAPIVTRVLLRRVARNGVLDPDWPAGGFVLVNEMSGISSLGMTSDGQGGVWTWWQLGSSPYVEHILSNGTPAPGFAGPLSPLDASAQYLRDLVATRGRDDGLAVGWTDGRPSRPGVRVRWLLGSGAPDPAEPDSARVAGPVRANGRGLLEDGQGGAYVAWDFQSGPNWDLLYLGHLSSPTVVGVTPGPAPRAAIALRSVSPNPTSDALAVRFTLAGAGPARIELLDVAGRRVRLLEVATSGSEQVARFEDLGRLPAGLYIVRLTQGGGARSARVAIVR